MYMCTSYSFVLKFTHFTGQHITKNEDAKSKKKKAFLDTLNYDRCDQMCIWTSYVLRRKEGGKEGNLGLASKILCRPIGTRPVGVAQGKGSSAVDPSIWTALRIENLPKHVSWESYP